MDDETLEASVAEAVLRDGARSVRSDTLLLVDPTEIRKEFSYKMEFVTRVRYASRSSKEGRDVLVNGYHGCMIAACRPSGHHRLLVPGRRFAQAEHRHGYPDRLRPRRALAIGALLACK